MVLINALKSTCEILNTEDAGTAMRFLTAYYAFSNRSIEIHGSQRMEERPIKALVDALKEIGAFISYLKNDGFPPLKIHAAHQPTKNELTINASISSQFITALLLSIPFHIKNFVLNLEGQISSKPYIDMTLGLLSKIGIESEWQSNSIRITQKEIKPAELQLETDWSAASYFYALTALSLKGQIQLRGLKPDSLQGDAVLAQMFEGHFGVNTVFNAFGACISKSANHALPAKLAIDFNHCPDLAQTMVVLCASLGVELKATGLKSLRIKETDRIQALETELVKFGITTNSTADSLKIKGKINADVGPIKINTYQDHRMAMAFSIIGFIRPVIIENEQVVQKSFPSYFQEFKKVIQ